MDGTVATVETPGVRVHIYTAPAEAFAVNTIVLELADRLIVLDGQMQQSYAAEAADVIAGMTKPIDRFVLTHDHPDHYSGFTTLTARFPGVQLAALPSVRQSLLNKSDAVLAVRRGMLGNEVAQHAVIPDATIIPGELTIAGQRFVFVEFDNTESEHALVIYLPDAHLALLADLVASPDEHLFTLQPNFDTWEATIERIRGDIARFGITIIVPGHGGPLTPAVLPANIAYLRAAKEAFATSGTSEEFKEALSAALPGRGPRARLEWSGQQLYGHVAP